MEDYGTSPASDMFVMERELPGSLKTVWSYITDSEKRRAWLASGNMDVQVGGKVELHFIHSELTPHHEDTPQKYEHIKDGVMQTGRIIALDPPHMLRMSWGGEVADSSEVTFELEERGSNTFLKIMRRKLKSREDMVSIAGGWHTHIGILLDKMQGKTVRPFWSTHTELVKEYEKKL